MNTDRIRRLIEHLEAVPDARFDMLPKANPWVVRLDQLKGGMAEHCIALFKAEAHDARLRNPGCASSPALLAGKVLDLTREQSGTLFMPMHGRLSAITRQDALATLRHLAATGEVRWSTQSEEGTVSGE